MTDRYYEKYALAYILGNLKRLGKTNLLPSSLFNKNLLDLTSEEKSLIFNVAKTNEIKLYHFKKTNSILPRVQKVLGFLHGVYFNSLLDVGSGRGVFLLPFLEEFSHIETTSVEFLPKRVDMLTDISGGGVDNLSVINADFCNLLLNENSVDVVTLLEVLEHIPNVEKAVENAVKIAKKCVVVTVPSKPDDNPEHIHLLTKNRLTELFNFSKVKKLIFDGVNGHLVMIALLEND
jgi:SAM-dependent methyltransferase